MFNFHIKTPIIYGVFGFWSIAEIIHYIRVHYFIYPKLNLIKTQRNIGLIIHLNLFLNYLIILVH